MWLRLGTIMISGWRVERAGLEREGRGGAVPAYGWSVRLGGKGLSGHLHCRWLSSCPVDKRPPSVTIPPACDPPFKELLQSEGLCLNRAGGKGLSQRKKCFSLNVRNLIISSTSWISESQVDKGCGAKKNRCTVRTINSLDLRKSATFWEICLLAVLWELCAGSFLLPDHWS